MIFKGGVSVKELSCQTLAAMNVADAVVASFGYGLVVTSVYRPPTSERSLHPLGHAFDFRAHDMSVDTVCAVAQTLRECLPEGYDVVVESLGTPNAHIHVEFDPK